MCGIVGIVGRDIRSSPDRSLLERMTGSLVHRGPDEGGVYVSGPVGLGHRRLAVIDLSNGRQPMIDKNAKRALVYNGEIYNFRQLRRSYASPEHRPFETDCDTEVLLRIASTTEFNWLETLNGMFAFGLWDEPTMTLLLGRDRLGVKPLYYAQIGEDFVFSSEVRALLLHPKFKPEVNCERIPEYLAFRTLCGTETMFKGIHEIPPGHVMLFSQKTFEGRLVKYWSEGNGKNVSDYVDPKLSYEQQFERLLVDSVRLRLISDVPVGTYNSGGLDSSLTTAITKSLTGGELHTFSVGFDEADYDESAYANIIATELKTQHHTLVISEREYLTAYEQTISHLEEPLNHAHTVQLLMLSKFAKQYVTVVLTGEGSDELFGGYPRFQIPLLTRQLSILPTILTRGALEISKWFGSRKIVKLLENADDTVAAVIENSRHTPRQDFEEIGLGPHYFTERIKLYRDAESRTSSVLGQMLYFDQRSYLPALLKRLDKASMAAAIECRVPYLDYRLVEWSALLPPQFKVQLGRHNKVIVKRVGSRWIPKEIVYRKKVGFGVPISRWMRNSDGLGRYLDLISDSTFKSRGYCDFQAVAKLIRDHRSCRADHGEILWGLINLELWWRLFVDSRNWEGYVRPFVGATVSKAVSEATSPA